jgi:hypothetical protein
MNTTTAEKKPRLTTSAMIASIASEGQKVKAAPFGKALVEYAASHPEVVGLTADLAKYTDLHLFAQAYPDRFHQMGMAEQLLLAAAGGGGGAFGARVVDDAGQAVLVPVVQREQDGVLVQAGLVPGGLVARGQARAAGLGEGGGAGGQGVDVGVATERLGVCVPFGVNID